MGPTICVAVMVVLVDSVSD